MKRQIRRGVFETNSSSTHSITMCSEEEYERWRKGGLLFNCWRDNFVEATDENKEDEDMKTYDEYWDDCEFETYEDSYTTKSGEKVIAFGYYGMDN